MRKILLGAVALAAFGFATAANAGLVTLSAGTGAGAANFNGFNDVAVTSTSGTTATYLGSVSFTTTPGNQGPLNESQVQDTSLTSEYLQPLADKTNYIFAQADGTVVLTLPTAVTSLTIYWGSPDTYNTVDLGNGDAFTGTLFASTFSVAANGNNANSRWVTITDTTAFKTVTLGSTSPAFEFDMAGSTVPETSTWAMMVLGFLGLGYAAFRRTAKGRVVATI